MGNNNGTVTSDQTTAWQSTNLTNSLSNSCSAQVKQQRNDIIEDNLRRPHTLLYNIL